ncbi:uncharacterized protein [Misgurnus anguillicaudatus]|uniref:uncharacterized protein isoform X4 n=1 Tax=Misgurnus anguillicaudatus TaxID=75329 RepID=UPI003CCFB2F9
MNTIQGFCCSIFGVLFFLLQGFTEGVLRMSAFRQIDGLCAETEVVHRAVGSSLELIPDHPKTNLTDVKWTFNETVFAEYTKNELKLLRDNLFAGWLEKGDISITVNNLQLQDSGLFSIVQEGHSGQYETKFIQLHVHGFLKKNLLLISIVAGAVCIAVAIGIIAVCYRRRAQKGKGESEAGITVYEDVNVDPVAKKRSDSTINGTSIYETVQDVRVTSNMPQTVYDKISYQRQQVVTPSTSSPYQKVL